MEPAPVHDPLDLENPDATCALAGRIGARLRPGDVLLLEGGVGAGKTHFARCLIQSRLPVPEDVPSPTFTLVQTYDAGAVEIWHADLYRLAGPSEIEELGLADAFTDAICLVEWPDRLGELTPGTALTLRFEDGADESRRHLSLLSKDTAWRARLSGVTA